MNQARAEQRIAHWLQPISAAQPAGEDARYHPRHEQVRAEAAKLDLPTGGTPDWGQVVLDAEKLTTETTKDLLIECYAAFALFQTEGLGGLASGLLLVAVSLERFWDSLYPAKRRMRARANAINWLVGRLEHTLPEMVIGESEGESIAEIDAALARLRAACEVRFEDPAPTLDPLLSAVAALAASAPVDETNTERDTQPPPAPEPETPVNPQLMDLGVESAGPPTDEIPLDELGSKTAVQDHPSASDDEESIDHADDLRLAAGPWVEPVAGGAPAGADARFHPDHERLRGEVAALDTPSGGALQWEEAVEMAGRLLKEQSKDLLIAAYFAFGKWETQRLNGLAVGLEVINQLCQRYWDTMYPPISRMRGRTNALRWLVERVDSIVPNQDLTASDAYGVELFAVAVRRLSKTVKEKFGDAAPALRSLLDAAERVRISLPPTPEPNTAERPPDSDQIARTRAPAQAEEPPKNAHDSTPSELVSTAALTLAPASLHDPDDAINYGRTMAKSLLGGAREIRRSSLKVPLSYRFVRMALALSTARLPPSEGKTSLIPEPPDVQIRSFETMFEKQHWDRLVESVEEVLPSKRFWLDLHRYSAEALLGLGADYEDARHEVMTGLSLWLKLFPGLLDMTFSGGRPFASDETKTWIDREILGRGRSGIPSAPLLEADEEIDAVKTLIAAGRVNEAVAALDKVVHSARSGRRRFLARLTMAEALSQGETASVAVGLFDGLVNDIQTYGIESWDPELAVAAYRAYVACLEQISTERDGSIEERLTDVQRRLVRVDPIGSINLGSSKRS